MIVCLCTGDNEKFVQQEIEGGCKSFEDLAKKCGIGQDCGICCDSARETFEKMQNAKKKKKKK
jgi:bacterioferritin-associated ferredoxin